MNAKNLVEMAMDPGQGPHLINPSKRQKIDTRQTPMSTNPSFPEGEYGEKMATQAYGKVLQGAERAMGQNLRNVRPHQIMNDLIRTVRKVSEIEKDHRPQLEELAVAIVLDLPEFKDAREAYINGDLRINARLMPEMPPEMNQANMQRVLAQNVDDEKSDELGLDVPEIKAQMDYEVNKRKFLNFLIQGAAVTKTHAYHLATSELNAISPELLGLYGKMTALGDLSYWMKPEDVFGGEHAGEESIDIEQNENGEDVYTVNATAINFPLLIHELAKGLYEVVFHNVIEDPTTREHVYSQADTLADEEWGIMKGPAVWMHFNHLVNKLNAAEYIPRILNSITSLSAYEFADIVRNIFSETPEGLDYLRNLVDEIKAEQESDES